MRHITIPIDAEEKTCGGCMYSSLSCSGESIGLTQCFNPAFEVGGEPPTTNGTRLPECLAAETRAGEVATLRADIERKDAAFEGHAKVSNELSKQAIRLADENAALRAEVARLTEERDYFSAERARLLPLAIRNTKSGPPTLIVLPPGVDGDIVKLRVENAKLTTQLAERDAALATAQAEVERLLSRSSSRLRPLRRRSELPEEPRHEARHAQGDVAPPTGDRARLDEEADRRGE